MANLSPALKGTLRVPRLSGLAGLLPLVLALLTIVSVVLLVQTSGMTTTGYDVMRLERERDDWKQRNNQLEAEAAKLRSLARVDDVARNKLKMTLAKQPLYITVDVTR